MSVQGVSALFVGAKDRAGAWRLLFAIPLSCLQSDRMIESSGFPAPLPSGVTMLSAGILRIERALCDCSSPFLGLLAV